MYSLSPRDTEWLQSLWDRNQRYRVYEFSILCLILKMLIFVLVLLYVYVVRDGADRVVREGSISVVRKNSVCVCMYSYVFVSVLQYFAHHIDSDLLSTMGTSITVRYLLHCYLDYFAVFYKYWEKIAFYSAFSIFFNN